MLEKEGGKLGKVVEYTSYPEAYQDLALGRVDYVVNTVINLQTMVAEKPAVFEFGQAVSGKSFPAWAVAKGNTELLEFPERLHRQGKGKRPVCRVAEEVVRQFVSESAGDVGSRVLTSGPG